MRTRLFLALAGALLLLRLPAVAQPMGADQGLYSYVGGRILAGELPYRDAWDQKPPAIHYTYAVMRAIWPGDGVVGAADLAAAAAVAWLLFRLGGALGSTAGGAASGLIFLLLANPAFTRLGGIRLRAQCETFIAVAVTAGFLVILGRRSRAGLWSALGAGALFGTAFVFKYNAGIFAAAGVSSAWLYRRIAWRDVVAVAAGFAVPVLVLLAIFASGGALRDLYDATIAYNVQYSGETYAGPGAALWYLVAFPIDRARVDALWTVGGAGCLVLILLSAGNRERLVAPFWVAAACLSIAVNGSRGLPQYFVQANPALALAAGWASIEAWRVLRARTGARAPAWSVALLLVVSLAVWRVNQFPKLVEQTAFDARYALGRMDRTSYLSRYADDRKYSSLAAAELADVVRAGTRAGDRIYIFGFTCAAYVDADRASASRFFWSRPVIVGFNAGVPGYGVEGLLGELQHHPPALVALQRKDWAPDVADSADFFMRTPALAGWLQSNYVRTPGPEAFDIWMRRAGDVMTLLRLSRTQALAILVVVAGVALALRLVFPAADPPWNPSVGVVWHDEGAWVHNARNKALFGAWTLDAWNPMYIAPVFTGLEYAAFELFGVGVRQARLVSELTGFASVLLLAWGVGRLGGREAAVIAGALLATNYVYVMYDRAATMEASMVAFMVASWYCYVRAQASPRWAWAAAAAALLAFFTKASAAFFVAALAGEAAIAWLNVTRGETAAGRRAGLWTVIALAVCGAAAVLLFVAPNWTDYRFYNWQMSVTRKPSYDLKSLVDRVTWFPILHDIFTRMWFTVVVGLTAALGLPARWRSAAPAERLLGLWMAVGALELMLHDVGNERRFLIFVPPLAAMAALALGRDRTLLPAEVAAFTRRQALVLLPVVLFALYVMSGTLVRLGHLYEVGPNVRLATVLAALAAAGLYASWPWLPRRLAGSPWSPSAGLLVAALVTAGQLAQFGQWAATRTYKNYLASIELGRRLAPGTLVHGKLANGLALENRIRPIFVGRGFGNFEDRKTRDDVRYILTYVAPSLGYESQARNPVIQDVLDAYPNHRIIMTFDVAETTTGHDRAALIDKFGSATAGVTGVTGRAQH